MFESKKLKMTINHKYPLEKGADALRLLMDRKATGKVCVCPKMAVAKL